MDLTDDVHCESGTDSTLSVAKLVSIGGERIKIDDMSKDPRFLNSRQHDTTKNLIAAAIMDKTKVVGVIIAINKRFRNEPQPKFSIVDLDMLEIVASNLSIALSNARKFAKTELTKLTSSSILSILRSRSSDEPLEKLFRTTIEAVNSMLKPEMVSIFLCDRNKEEVFIVASKDKMEGLTIPFGQGIVGSVAKNGTSSRVADAYSDPRFFPAVDRKTGNQTRTLLCVPVPGFLEKSRPLAAIQAINKLDNTQFTEEEQHALETLAAELSLALRQKAIELSIMKLGARINDSDGDAGVQMELEKGVLEEYGAFQRYGLHADGVLAIKNSPLQRGGSASNLAGMVDESTIDLDSVKAKVLTDRNADPFLITDDFLVETAVNMMISYGLAEKFSITTDRLRSFILTVRETYRPENSFHNFYHAWGVMHLSYHILRAGADRCLTPLDKLVLFLAAITHDCSHPGNNNAFEIATRSDIATLYSDDAVLERHHSCVARKIIESPSLMLMAGLTEVEQRDLKSNITASILATDMAQHFRVIFDDLHTHDPCDVNVKYWC